MNIQEKPGNVWGWCPPENPNIVRYEDGTEVPFTTSVIVVGFGKYKGMKLSEVNDKRYLEWLYQSGVDKKDTWLCEAVSMRLRELV